MIAAASNRLKQITPTPTISAFLSTSCFWDYRNRGIKQISRYKVMNFVNGHLVFPLQVCRFCQYVNCITSTSVKVFRRWPIFLIQSTLVGKYQSLSLTTQASSFEEEVVGQILNQILTAIEFTPSSSKEICEFHIEKLCRAKKLGIAAKLLQYLRDKHIFFSPRAYNSLLEAVCEENDVNLLVHVFKDALFSGESMTSISFLNFAKGFTKDSDSVLLLRFVQEVSELTFPKNITVVNRIIYAFAECGQIDKALLVFDYVKTLRCEPDLVTYNTVLHILGRTNRIDEMLREFGSMKMANIAPDVISYNTLLNSLQKVGKLDQCLEFLKEMGERGIQPDLQTYTPMIEGFGRAGNVEVSLRLFSEMKLRHIRPSIYVYRSLINYLKKMGKLELAITLSEEMNVRLPDLVGPKDFKRKDW